MSEEHTHPFPEFEPEVTIRPAPEATLTEVLRTDLCFGSGVVPLVIGAEQKWSFYDWPERDLTNVSDNRVVGYVRFRGERLLAIYDRIIFGEDPHAWNRRLYRWQDETLALVLYEWAEKGGNAAIEEVDATPEPLRLKLGMRWQGHEIYQSYGDGTRSWENQRSVVEGPMELRVPAGTFLCLRQTWWSSRDDGSGNAMAEWYVTEAGRTMYFRRFSGPTWAIYHELGKVSVPEREFEGVTWRLWYECLPETAL